ncbi:MAG: 6,7-dimethyl-8-ribityllumazine synthase [Verrucomicrobia bacterium]|jgi:6,7-dimethyl-8-ribityllumazine synthase|nr:6,7-dimethyl-8-ribityllumazine synthase [Verrucomicrobiota bacterium]
MAVNEVSVDLNAEGKRFSIVVSRFNDFLTKQLVSGAIDCIVRHGGSDEDITIVWVPGANEVPQATQKLAAAGKADAVIALGAVVQGATPHADLINTQVSKALSDLALRTGIPIVNGVVCAGNLEQAIERCGTKAGNKGWNAAQAAIEMANLFNVLG